MSQTATVAQTFEVVPLQYGYDALTPQISEETMRYHHDKHLVGYVNKLNELIVDTPFTEMSLEEIILNSDGALFNNAAQVWNHNFYFESLSPTPKNAPTGHLLDAIEKTFGSFVQFKAQMGSKSLSLFGSGWVWLAVDKMGKLVLISESNAGNPLTLGFRPILAIDVWEHAYYIDYRNKRVDYVDNIWQRIDWHTVEKRYAEALKGLDL